VTEPGWITFDQFSGRVGQTFDVADGSGTAIEAELVEAVETAQPGGTGPDGRRRLQFSLVFRGPTEPALAQATHALDHPDLGHLDVFLVPIGPDAQGMRYQAVFG
jgi:hypothetical protein